MIPIFGLGEETDFLYTYLNREFDICREEVLDFDLYLYNPDEPEIVGLQKEFLCAPRIDNLASVSALIETMESMKEAEHSTIAVAAMYDNEEIGSRSKQGADSVLLARLLDRLGEALRIDPDDWRETMAKSFLLSMEHRDIIRIIRIKVIRPIRYC